MGVNKVDLANGENLIDLTNDSITAESLFEGLTAHDSKGEPVIGMFPNGEIDIQANLIEQIKSALEGKAAGSGGGAIGDYDVGYSDGFIAGAEDCASKHQSSKTITENGKYTPDLGYNAFSEVIVEVPVPEGYIIPSGTKTIDQNGTHDVTEYASVEVDVATGGAAEDNIGLLITGNLERLESNITGTFNQYAFYGNTGLKYVSLPNIQYSKERIFYGCSNLETLLLPGLIGYTYQYLAYNCSKLATVDVHNTSYVSSYSFSNCAKLTRIELDRAETVATNAFNGCSALSTIIIRAEAVPTLGGTNAFTNTPIAKNTGYIYVPAALIDKYKAATNWSTYAARFRAIEDYPTVISGGDE